MSSYRGISLAKLMTINVGKRYQIMKRAFFTQSEAGRYAADSDWNAFGGPRRIAYVTWDETQPFEQAYDARIKELEHESIQ